MIFAAQTDWGVVGQNLAVLLIGLISTWNLYKTNKTQKTVEKTAQTVEVVKTLSDGAMGLQKRALAEVTAAKAAITRHPEDEAAAATAMKDYLDHALKEAKINGLERKLDEVKKGAALLGLVS